MDTENDDLDQLLLLATSDEAIASTILNNDDSRTNMENRPSNSLPQTVAAKNESSVCQQSVKLNGDGMDSSDEEDLQNFLEQKYHEYGRGINSMIKQKNNEQHDSFIDREITNDIRWKSSMPKVEPAIHSKLPPVRPSSLSSSSAYKPKPIENINVYTDPIFGLRIVQPLVSSAMLNERMVGRTPVDIRNLEYHITASDLKQDWCMGGVVISKSAVQTSQKGSQYIIWKISDLKADIKTVSLFLFKNAYKELWKTSQGTAVAILNPSVFPRKDGKSGEISLSIDSAQKVMILGRSKDLGTCKSRKKNGEPCTAVVNVNTCEFCVYHVKHEYGKMSGRSELQSATSGRGLQSLRNKVLGKSEVFYGGQSFMAEPAKKNPKLAAKDQHRLMTLSEQFQSTPLAAAIAARPAAIRNFGTNKPVSRIAEGIDINISQRRKDLERLNLLKGTMSSPSGGNVATSSNSPSPSLVTRPSLAAVNASTSSPTLSNFSSLTFSKAPKLSQEGFSFSIDRNAAAKAKALQILKKTPIEKSNPNLIKYRGTDNGKKRLLETMVGDDDESAAKKRKQEEVEAFKNERIQRILEAKSSHQDLVRARENSEQDKYFSKLEKKEMMEEKMLNTMKVECKAVVCPVCKYKAFTAAERCKTERHPFKVVEAEKRFFECEDCGNRVVSLYRIPKISCANCQSSRWKRTGMIREKKMLVGEQLSIRGDEETFLGSVQTQGNLNLCVSGD